ncbi:lysophospholipid acyltransferase family protein [Azospirillum sp.]|uniref:lysophospholipid acyltransferase family protein n=1 Tax=Azospirillum sp. TaxID=34012 RepID=UPI002D66EE1A|nr:lysophospholipid acyltransferase family protein [Azospirillum sp.]HYD65568.1 lysophospholipid acyltransferase family protein [Azospirillum sp.]
MTTTFHLMRRYVVRPIAALVGRLDVTGRQHLPDQGGYVVACNHMGWVDPLWLGLAVDSDRVHYMAKRELFSPAPLGVLMRQCHVFPVDRQRPGPDTIKTAVRLLGAGQVVLVFPGGTRTAEAASFKRGAATIAAMAGVPVVPAQYSGPTTIKPAHLLKRPAVRIAFGAPILPDRRAGDDTRARIQAVTDRLEQSVAELAGV